MSKFERKGGREVSQTSKLQNIELKNAEREKN